VGALASGAVSPSRRGHRRQHPRRPPRSTVARWLATQCDPRSELTLDLIELLDLLTWLRTWNDQHPTDGVRVRGVDQAPQPGGLCGLRPRGPRAVPCRHHDRVARTHRAAHHLPRPTCPHRERAAHGLVPAFASPDRRQRRDPRAEPLGSQISLGRDPVGPQLHSIYPVPQPPPSSPSPPWASPGCPPASWPSENRWGVGARLRRSSGSSALTTTVITTPPITWQATSSHLVRPHRPRPEDADGDDLLVRSRLLPDLGGHRPGGRASDPEQIDGDGRRRQSSRPDTQRDAPQTRLASLDDASPADYVRGAGGSAAGSPTSFVPWVWVGSRPPGRDPRATTRMPLP
jgi:hypothetical protein